MWWAVVVMVTVPLFWFSIDIAASMRSRRPAAPAIIEAPYEREVTVLVPIHGSARYLENAAYLSGCGGRVVLCTRIGENEEFHRDLQPKADAHGLSVYDRPHSRVTASANRRNGGTIRDRVVRDALNELGARSELGRHVVCVDADTTTPRPLGALVAGLRHSAADFASVRLVPQTDGPMLVQLQRFQHAQAMRMRSVLPWLLSGACHVGRSDVLRAVMERHPMFFRGNDVEAGLIADQLGYLATHIPFAAVIAVYFVYVTWAHWSRKNLWLRLLPFYLLFNSLVMVAVGVLWYFVMAVPERNFGVISHRRARTTTATGPAGPAGRLERDAVSRLRPRRGTPRSRWPWPTATPAAPARAAARRPRRA